MNVTCFSHNHVHTPELILNFLFWVCLHLQLNDSRMGNKHVLCDFVSSWPECCLFLHHMMKIFSSTWSLVKSMWEGWELPWVQNLLLPAGSTKSQKVTMEWTNWRKQKKYHIYPRIGRIHALARGQTFNWFKPEKNEVEETVKQSEVLNQQQLMCIKSSLF